MVYSILFSSVDWFSMLHDTSTTITATTTINSTLRNYPNHFMQVTAIGFKLEVDDATNVRLNSIFNDEEALYGYVDSLLVPKTLPNFPSFQEILV